MIVAAALVLWVFGSVLVCIGSRAEGQSLFDILFVICLICAGAAAQFCAVLLII